MRRRVIIGLALCAAILAGCGGVEQQRAASG
jgi:hypothetical protein